MKPKTLSELKHGNLLTKGNYPTFVETFNYVVKRLDNLVGDRDVNPQTGTIRVDNTDPEHPVIRCDKPILSGNGGAVAFGDSDLSDVGLSSVHVADLSGTPYIQLYKFNENGTSLPKKAISLSSDGFTPLLPSDYEFVLRKNGASGQLEYANLSCCIPDLSALSGTSISGDHNVIPGFSNSIDTKKDSRGTYHQLHGFENPTTKNFYQLIDGKYQFVIRDYNSQDKYVVYSDISSFVNSLVISGDANIPATRTITLANENGRKFYKLYNWQGNNHVPLTAEIKADGQIHYINEVNGAPGPKHLLFEDHMTGELEYHALGLKIPTPELSDVGGGDEIIQNITVISSDLSGLSADLSALDNFWVKGEGSQENYGSSIGDSSKSTVINLDTKRLNGTWYTDGGDFNVGGTCFARKLESSTVLQIGGTTINETQLQQLLALLNT